MNARRAALLMIASGALYAILWACIRYASAQVHPFVIVFFRNVFGLLALAPWLIRTGRAAVKTRRFTGHLARGLASTIAMAGIYYSISAIPLAQVVALSYAAPLFAALGAVVVLGEKLRARRITAILIGFAGMLIVLRPGIETFSLGVGAALVGALGMAGVMLTVKNLADTERPATIVVYANSLTMPAALALAIWFWRWPVGVDWIWLVLIGTLSTLAQILMNRAFALADTSVILPYDFLRLLFATGLGVALFGERIDMVSILGAAIILGATVYVARRDMLARARRRA